MLRRINIPLTFALLLLAETISPGADRPSNSDVSFSATLKESSVKSGGSGTLLITLRPKNGIHVNLNPPITVTFDSNSIVATAGRLEVPKADTVLDASKPIKLPLRFSKTLKSGTATIRGTVTYFYCSEAEEWCSRFKQPFEVAVSVRK